MTISHAGTPARQLRHHRPDKDGNRHMDQWEYTTVIVSPLDIHDVLKVQGRAGWEAWAMKDIPSLDRLDSTIYLKRKIKD